MPHYEVTITETLRRSVEVEAASREEAKRIVESQWRDGTHVLLPDDFAAVDFTVRRPPQRRGPER